MKQGPRGPEQQADQHSRTASEKSVVETRPRGIAKYSVAAETELAESIGKAGSACCKTMVQPALSHSLRKGCW